MKIKKVMRETIAIDTDMSIEAAAKIMADRNIGSLVIVNKTSILGIITERDILRNVSIAKKKVSTIMTKKVITIDPDEDIDYAAEIMAQHKIRRLPVVKKDKLVGIITAMDLIEHNDELNEDFFID